MQPKSDLVLQNCGSGIQIYRYIRLQSRARAMIRTIDLQINRTRPARASSRNPAAAPAPTAEVDTPTGVRISEEHTATELELSRQSGSQRAASRGVESGSTMGRVVPTLALAALALLLPATPCEASRPRRQPRHLRSAATAEAPVDVFQSGQDGVEYWGSNCAESSTPRPHHTAAFTRCAPTKHSSAPALAC